MKVINKRVPKGNTLLFISFAAMSLVIMILISTMRMEDIRNIVENSMESEIITQGEEITFFERFLSANNIMNGMYIMITICFILSSIVVTTIWRGERHQLLYALKLCGISNTFQSIEIIKRYLMVVIVGFSFATVMATVITRLDDIVVIGLSDVAWSFLITTITCLMILLLNSIFDFVKRYVIGGK
ncbi:MAG: hypothetical protein E7265_02045 [Lachnospiraceae bacterium]|nr:hypothetical protein [Lachnospiraceae bacterium]